MVSISKQTWSVLALGVASGIGSFLMVLLCFQTEMWSLRLGSPGIIFGIAVIMLMSIRRHSVWRRVAWVCASWVSFQGAFWFWMAMNTLYDSSLFQLSLLFGSVGFVGGIILLTTCRMLIGKIAISETVSSLCCAFFIPAVLLVITGVEGAEWFDVPPMHYFLFVMILWQTVALFFIDVLARKHAPQDVLGARTA